MRALARAAILGLLVVASPGFPDSFQEINRQFSQGVVKIMVHHAGVRQSIGTGFIIDNRNTIVTNAHVLHEAKAVFARFPNGQIASCKLIDSDYTHDLAIIRPDQGAIAAPILRLAPPEKTPRQLDDVMLISNPEGLSGSAVTGKISALRRSTEVLDEQGNAVFRGDFRVYQVDLSASHGSSGGPVIDSSGNVVGVLTAGIRHGARGLNFAIPHHHVAQLNTSASGRAFGGQDNFELSRDFSSVGLSYNVGTPGRPGLNIDGQHFDVSSDHWGFIDPTRAGDYLDDVDKAVQIVPLHFFDELARRHRIVNITNAHFRIGMLVPEHYHLEEDYHEPTRTYRGLLTAPEGYSVRITARRIPQPAADQMHSALKQWGDQFLGSLFGPQYVVPRFTAPAQRQQMELGPLSDRNPRWGSAPGTVKYWLHYLHNPVQLAWDAVEPTEATMTLHGINQDLFVTVDFSYRLGWQGLTPADVVERMFIASSVSFIH